MKLTIISETVIFNEIYEIRGQKVTLNSDLAELYGIETRILNQALMRNSDRFLYDLLFQFSKQE